MNEWIITKPVKDPEQILKYESIMYQGNGYMGVRNSPEEGYPESQKNIMVNGVFNTPKGEVSELASLADVTNCEITIDGERFSLSNGKVSEYKHELNMRNGESVRSFVWTSPDGVCLKMKFSRFVSLTKKHIIAQKIEITPDAERKFVIMTGIDGKITNTGVQHFYDVQKRMYPDNQTGLYMKTTQSEVQCALTTSVKCDIEHDYMVITDRRSIYSKLVFNASEKITIEKISSVISSRDICYLGENPDYETLRVDGKKYLDEAVVLGYDELFEESKKEWENFWEENYIKLETDNPFEQKAVNFSQYHLNIMANKDDNRVGVGAKGLSGEAYKGHSFWDTEIFVLPYYIFTAPKTARNLLKYRYKLLEVSNKKAQRYGYEGAMYPWEAAWIDDGESCPDFGDMDMVSGKQRRNLMGELEVHISADIAYGVWMYYMATGDDEFMEKYGYEMIVKTAIFWLSRVEEKNCRYEILDVIGPDEYKDGIDNNSYTNYMAYFNVMLAENYVKELKEEIKWGYNLFDLKTKFNDFLSKVYLPKEDADGIISQFDGYKSLGDIEYDNYKNKEKVGTIFNDYSYAEIQDLKVSKQADTVMLFYLIENVFAPETIAKNFKYYEKRTLHDSSLSMCIHALVAARLGIDEMADKLFLDCCSVDLSEKINNSDAGIHSASIGGIWLALVMGYAGMRVTEKGIEFNTSNVKKTFTFTIYYKGSKLKIENDGNRFNILRLDGEKVTVYVNGEERVL